MNTHAYPPRDAAQHPGAPSPQPVRHAPQPVQHASPPVYAQQPGPHAQQPVGHAHPPVHAQQPVGHAYPPVHAQQPGPHAHPPVHAQPPVGHAYRPVQHAPPPVPQAHQPIQYAQQPVPHTPASNPQRTAPGCPHAYPVAAKSAGFFAALGLSVKVLPYALFRFAHWSMFTAITIGMVLGILALGGTLAVTVNNWVGTIVMLGGLIPIFWFWMPFVERKTFGAKCAHIAILTELVTRGGIGDGKQGQLAYAKQLVETRLGDLTSIWDVYRSVGRTLRQLTKTLDFVDDLLPIDISFIKRGISALVRGASRYLDAVVLSYGLARGDRDFSAPAIDGLTYCAQNGGKMFRAAVGVIALEKLMLLPLWVCAAAGSIGGVFAATFAAQGGSLPALSASPADVVKAAPGPFLVALAAALIIGSVIALLIVRTVRESFVQPTLITMVMLRFHKMVQGQPLDEGWKQKLRQAGDGIGQLDEIRARALRSA